MPPYRGLCSLVPIRGYLFPYIFLQMTLISTATIDPAAALVAEFAGGSDSSVDMMVGIGVLKDSDAVFFQYLGDTNEPAALMLQSGKPLTRMGNVTLTGISVADDIGEFNATKLNVFLETSKGTTVLVTSGLTTIWSQCIINGLMAMFNGGDLTCPFNLDTWKGNSKMKPCFGGIRVGQAKMSDNDLYQQLTEARTDGNKQLVETIMRDSVQILSHALTGGPVEEAVVTTEPTVTVAAEF
jgi:hypothetical protein